MFTGRESLDEGDHLSVIHAAFINTFFFFYARHGNTFKRYHATDTSDEHESLITSSYIHDESCCQGV